MTRRYGAALFVCLALGASPAAGQRVSGSLTLAAARLRFAGAEPQGTWSLTPTIEWEGARGAVAGYANLARLEGASSSQGALWGTWQTPSFAGGYIGEIGASAATSSPSDGYSTTQLSGSARVRRLVADAWFWLGAEAGGLRLADRWRPLVRGEAGTAVRRGIVRGSLVVQPTRGDSVGFIDLRGEIGVAQGRFGIEGSLGIRGGDAERAGLPSGRQWGSVLASWWVRPHWAVDGAMGTYPSDPTQGFPGGRFASLGVRVVTGREFGLTPGLTDARDGSSARSSVRAFRLVRLSREGGLVRVRIEVRAAGAKRIDINGDVTGWQPVRLDERSPGVWAWEGVMTAGPQELVVRTDGGPWLVPPGLTAVRDEFGGRAGRLIVE